MDYLNFLNDDEKNLGEPFKLPEKIVLASASPRRRELIGKIVSDYEMTVADSEEILPCDIDVLKAPEYLAKIKADAVSKILPGRVIIGCDTVVISDNKILGKPLDENDAERMLKSLSGKTHFVVSGVCITDGEYEDVFSSLTKVTFKKLTEKEIREYVASGDPMDKAGAYGIQSGAGRFVEAVDGSLYNVIGFPIKQIKEHLLVLFSKKHEK